MEDARSWLSLRELIQLNCIVCGLELTASAAIVYLPPMLLEAGFQEGHMSWVLGMGPFLCLFFVPIMGQWMDTCSCRYGRRIPFMVAISLLVLLSLVLIPYADHMAPEITIPRSTISLHAWLLALTVVLIDFATQAGLTPCEVFLQDVTKGLPIRERAFSLYSLMCSLGSCMGYLILAINWEKTFLGPIFGDQEYCVFSLLFVIFSLLMFVNLATASSVRKRLSPSLTFNQSHIDLTLMTDTTSGHNSPSHVSVLSSRRCRPFWRLLKLLTPRGLQNLLAVPYALRRLIYANFFAWAGVMCFLLFYADFVGEVVYRGSPSADLGTLPRQQFDAGVRMGSFGLFLHAIMSMVSAPLIETFSLRYGMRVVHLSSLGIFSGSLCLMLLTENVILLNGLAMVTGVGFAAMTTIPFSLVGMYHEEKEKFFSDNPSLIHLRGIGTDMATLDTAYYCSQLCAIIQNLVTRLATLQFMSISMSKKCDMLGGMCGMECCYQVINLEVLLLSVMGYLVHLAGSASMYIITAAVLSSVSTYFIYTAVYTPSDMPTNAITKHQNNASSLNPPKGPIASSVIVDNYMSSLRTPA